MYQPVADIRRGSIVGVEALARFTDRTPDVWFEEAWSVGLGLELEIEAIRRAFLGFDELPPSVYMAVNAAPQTLLSNELSELLSSAPCDRVVVELTEHAAVDDYDQMNEAITRLRARGVRLSIDDAGAGISSLQHVLQLRPDTIKLDRSLTSHVDDNPVRAALAAALVTFAGSLGANICAEGIETVAQLVALQRLGVAYGQGYYLARPGPLPVPSLPEGVWTTLYEGPEASPRLRPSPAVTSPARLTALRETKLLDSAKEEDFDRFTRIASTLLGVPVALISLVDERRQFFKSEVGLPEAVASARETPLTHSFCQHTVTTRLPFAVEDAKSHPLVRDNGAVEDLGVAAYLGVPLLTHDEHAIGSFCAISHTPRAWSAADVTVMKSVASMVMDQVQLQAEVVRNEEREALHRQVVMRSPASLFVADIAGLIKLASVGLCRLLGRDLDGVQGHYLRTFVHPADLPAAIELHRRLLVGEIQDAELSLRFVGAEREPVPVTLTWYVLRSDAGRACLMSGSVEAASGSRVSTRASVPPPLSSACRDIPVQSGFPQNHSCTCAPR